MNEPTQNGPLRFGTLGAASITPTALLKPAHKVPEVEIVAVAARDHARGEKFAKKHDIATLHDSYEALLADPSVQAVYNPLPNGLHGRWTIAALEAGKHVLCEKPFTANTEEAEAVAAVAAKHPELVVMEAFHYRYHPLVQTLLDIIAGGEIGTVRRIETQMCIPLVSRKDIRYQLDLAGGALMDVGCYAIHQLRTLAGATGLAGAPEETPLAASTNGGGAEPTVVSAKAKCLTPEVDRWATAEMTFADGRTGGIECALWSRKPLSLGAKVEGDLGEIKILNMTGPQYYHRVTVRSRDARSGARSKRSVKVKGESTYRAQLEAFAASVDDPSRNLTPPSDSIATMRVIDAVYRAAGLQIREPSR